MELPRPRSTKKPHGDARNGWTQQVPVQAPWPIELGDQELTFTHSLIHRVEVGFRKAELVSEAGNETDVGSVHGLEARRLLFGAGPVHGKRLWKVSVSGSLRNRAKPEVVALAIDPQSVSTNRCEQVTPVRRADAVEAPSDHLAEWE